MNDRKPYCAPFGWPKTDFEFEVPERPEIEDADHDGILYVRQNRAWVSGLALIGGVMLGPLRLWRDAASPLEAVTKRQFDIKDFGTY